MENLIQIGASFLAGLFTSVSPCVYPTLPLTLSYLSFQNNSSGVKKPVILFYLGQSLAYVLIGYLAVKIGEVFGFTSQSKWVNYITGTFLLLMAIISLVGRMPTWLSQISNSARDWIEKYGQGKNFFALFVGMAAAFVASPCTSPVLGGVLTSIAGEPWSVISLLSLLFYGFGASMLVLVLGLGLVRWSSMPKSGAWLTYLQRFTSIGMIAASVFYFLK